jgi:hypothetical protein
LIKILIPFIRNPHDIIISGRPHVIIAFNLGVRFLSCAFLEDRDSQIITWRVRK